jgi:hypothetical protein
MHLHLAPQLESKLAGELVYHWVGTARRRDPDSANARRFLQSDDRLFSAEGLKGHHVRRHHRTLEGLVYLPIPLIKSVNQIFENVYSWRTFEDEAAMENA